MSTVDFQEPAPVAKPTYTQEERWRYLANVRQSIISKLEKKLVRADAENVKLRKALGL